MFPQLIFFLCMIMFPVFVWEWGGVVDSWSCIMMYFYYYAIQAGSRIRQCLQRLSEEHMSDVCTVGDRCFWNSVSK